MLPILRPHALPLPRVSKGRPPANPMATPPSPAAPASPASAAEVEDQQGQSTGAGAAEKRPCSPVEMTEATSSFVEEETVPNLKTVRLTLDYNEDDPGDSVLHIAGLDKDVDADFCERAIRALLREKERLLSEGV